MGKSLLRRTLSILSSAIAGGWGIIPLCLKRGLHPNLVPASFPLSFLQNSSKIRGVGNCVSGLIYADLKPHSRRGSWSEITQAMLEYSFSESFPSMLALEGEFTIQLNRMMSHTSRGQRETWRFW
ncbi:hypothetical protein I7I50_10376 [Histoplasma capsulatum G186AR]|uniref:Uncharacterized protein n=1 Tax=Ajellomyces capsulatus TaxID=5037 RepID=A0A8H7Z3N9_AJECA|nr:hypothetical protein I7I52_01615 [Histoplasma capsulatum]QSS69177.1 hypothetical protein I7I50_10376 [Histoplasma capsulatum G186AR]